MMSRSVEDPTEGGGNDNMTDSHELGLGRNRPLVPIQCAYMARQAYGFLQHLSISCELGYPLKIKLGRLENY